MDTTGQPIQQNQPNASPIPATDTSSVQYGFFKHISGKTLILILALALFTAFFLYLALKPTTSAPVVSRIQPTPTPNVAQSVLTLTAVTLTASPAALNNQKSFTIDVDSSNNKVTAVQVTLGFDPKNISNITITPGSFFPQATELIKNIDYTGGRIAYAIAIPPTGNAVVGKGTIATVHYTVLPTASGNITFTFMPKTLITAEGINPSVLKKSVGLNIPLSLRPNIATPSSR